LNPTPREELKKSLQQDGSLRSIEGPYRTKDGAIRIALTSAEAIEIGNETCILTVTADTTERKRAEVQFQLAFETAPHGMMILDQQGIITLINSKTEKLFGYGRSDLLGQSIERIVPEVFQMNSSALSKDTDLKGKEPSKMLLARRHNGTRFFVEIGLNLMDTQDGTRILASIVDMTEHEQAEEVRFRHTAIVESTDDAIISRNLEGVIQTWNAGAQRMFGYTAAEAIGQPITIIVPHELEDEENEMLELSKAGIRVGHFETVRVSKEGRKVQVSLTISPLKDFAGRIAGSSKIARDITERKQAEQTLRESEERFRLVANSAPVLIWMSGTDGLFNFFNERWLNFRGRTVKEESGEGWISGLHPDDREHYLRIYLGAFDARVEFEIEYRLRRFDGVYRWIVDYGVPRFESDGTFLGYIGSCLDITERKLSEEALLDMSGRLIAAHEEERTRIARELHDDLSQRMALLEIGIEQLMQETPGIQLAAKELLDNIAHVANEISSDIHNLSHELHPSKLDALGLVAAVGGLCREFSKQHGLQVRFVHHDIPTRISKDLTLCLFRIVQEALRNVVKYSGTASAQVELIRQQDLIHLCISDSGAGFDPESAKGKSGLGLISMRERLRLVGGHLVVESTPSHGTRIRVYAPLTASQGNFTAKETALAARAQS
jgi:PAS domain S-box-containing protein